MAGKAKVAPADNGAASADGDDQAKGSYRAILNVRANKKDFVAGDVVTGLSEAQATELLALGVIEKKQQRC